MDVGEANAVYKGDQWMVHSDGDITLLNGDYCIKSDRLLELGVRGGESVYDWPLHMAGKNWCFYQDFAAAWVFAINHKKLDYKIGMIERSLRKGAKDAAEETILRTEIVLSGLKT